MRFSHPKLSLTLAAVGVLAPGFLIATAARAQNADAACNACNLAFLVQSNGQTCYSTLGAAVSLYRITGNQSYYNDALLVADHTVNKGSSLHNSGEDGSNQWAYWFTRGLSDFATEVQIAPVPAASEKGLSPCTRGYCLPHKVKGLVAIEASRLDDLAVQ